MGQLGSSLNRGYPQRTSCPGMCGNERMMGVPFEACSRKKHMERVPSCTFAEGILVILRPALGAWGA